MMARLAPAMALLLLMGADQPTDASAPVRAIAERFAGELGVFAKHLGTGEIVAWNADARFPTASVIKVAIMVEAFDQISLGTLAADAIVRVRDGAKVGGSGVARELHSAGASKEMRAILEAQQDARMLARRLPFDTREIVVGNKTGTDEEKLPDASGSRGHVRADIGIVRVDDVTYVVAIFARRVKDRSWMADNAALVAGAEISRIVFDRFVGSSRQ